jgi:hypothetical protein
MLGANDSFENIESSTLTDEQLSRENGFLPSFTVWTKDRIYFPRHLRRRRLDHFSSPSPRRNPY